LFWVLNARLVHKAKGEVRLGAWPAGTDLDLAEDFLLQVGVGLERAGADLLLRPLDSESFKEAAAKKHGWIAPQAYWALALSLGAFLRANLKLSNPDCVYALLPSYWNIYNKLPNPRLTQENSTPAQAVEAPRRRRFLARTSVPTEGAETEGVEI
jgi:hypothetical protein